MQRHVWDRTHRDWLLSGGDPNNALLNLGNPTAPKFVADFISAKIDEFGLGCYRQDFNIDPLGYWQANNKRRIAKGSPKSATSRACIPSGMNCFPAIPG